MAGMIYVLGLSFLFVLIVVVLMSAISLANKTGEERVYFRCPLCNKKWHIPIYGVVGVVRAVRSAPSMICVATSDGIGGCGADMRSTLLALPQTRTIEAKLRRLEAEQEIAEALRTAADEEWEKKAEKTK